MLNVFKYFDQPNELNRSDLISHMHLLHDELHYGLLGPKDKEKLKPLLPLIKKSAQSAGLYAKYILQKRWPEAEPTIMKNPLYAYHYAVWVLQSPWPEAEPYIMKDPELWELYTEERF